MNKLVVFISVLFSLNIYGQKPEFNKDLIPQPIFDKNPEMVQLYWVAWEIAYNHIKDDNGLIQSPYLDEAFWDDTIWIWDTEFMSLFSKYAPRLFPGIESLNNFYEVLLNSKSSPLSIRHPDNPPFFAWIESEYYKFTNDTSHLSNLINKKQFLQRHYLFFDTIQVSTNFHFTHAPIKISRQKYGYLWGGDQSGMDNTPRGREKRSDMFWVDALSQQALSALYISRLANEVGDIEVAQKFEEEYQQRKKLLNTYYWDKEDGFYYDILQGDKSFLKVRTPASYWAMLAEVPTKEMAYRMMQYAKDTTEFGGKYPWPSVSRSDKDFNGEYGDYWRGSVWIPTAYMATKALEKYGFYDVADNNAYNVLNQMVQTYDDYKPATIWECYNPTKAMPAQRVYKDSLSLVRPDFCGWSALGPISMLIENVLGFHVVDAQSKTVEWRKYQSGKHGIENLQFGDVCTDIIGYDSYVEVKSNSEYTLIINGVYYKIHKGDQRISLN